MKRYGNQLQTGAAGVEKSLLRDVVLSHLDDLKVYGDDKLVKWVKAPKALCDSFAQYFRLPFLQHELCTSVWANCCKRGDVCLVDIPGFGDLEGTFLNKTPTIQPFPKENPGEGLFLKRVNWR